ncbi:hypothetical protein EXIGLDRAFT_727387 [Exidia glandulosa HHB12029]|uniref:Uncharacterized protein n=1 Tax=Exidia glandulosa HHB12029 TaxID=1314781 RepID=A0A165M2N4_EXIGL|nr:hypothetical protein EXIGLDRAFT_727387 [Exidia glandulosa HHB12029]
MSTHTKNHPDPVHPPANPQPGEEIVHATGTVPSGGGPSEVVSGSEPTAAARSVLYCTAYP